MFRNWSIMATVSGMLPMQLQMKIAGEGFNLSKNFIGLIETIIDIFSHPEPDRLSDVQF